MNIQQIKSGRLKIIFEDNGRSKTLYNKARLNKLLKAFGDEISTFLAKKSQHFNGIGKEIAGLEMHLALCGKRKIQTLNRNYRRKDKATDVLSFPVHETLRPKQHFFEKELDLGNIFICREVALSQARSFGITLEIEVIFLAVHGVLHLFGFDHELNKREEKIMFELEKILMKKIMKKV